jgi:hypothetical protein
MENQTTMKIYLYSFEMAYEDQLALNREPMLKIGQTTQATVEERILQQMGTSNPQKYDLKGRFEATFTDKQFHAFLATRGVKKPDGYGTEWFYITAEKAEELLKEFAALTGGLATPIRLPLTVRPYQREFVEKFVSTSGDFLLFAKCRAGKSVMGLLAATEAGLNSVLVVSLRTSAANSWLTDAKTFTVFHEWDVIDLHDADAIDRIKESQKAGRRTLMVGTVQATDKKFSLQSKLKRVFPNGMDALFLDECHIGGLAQMVSSLREEIGFARRLEISGTAFRAAYFYDREHTYTWDYTREQQAKRDGAEWAKDLPSMELIFARYDSARLAEVYGDDPDRLNNVWTITESGEWADESSVRHFIAQYFAHGGQVRKQKQLLHSSDHIVMTLPSVDACRKAVELFTEMNLPWVPMDITAAAGVTQEDIVAHTEAHPRTICFTYSANIVGVTVKKWDTVIHGRRSDSAEHWIQFTFRGGSTTRSSWRVIDFNPEQAISSVISMVQAVADAEEISEPGNSLRTFLDFADTFEFADGFTTLNYEAILGIVGENLEGAIDSLKREATGLGTYGEYSDELVRAFNEATAVKDVTVLNVTLNANDTADDGNVRVQRVAREASPKERENLLKRIKGALEFAPSVVATHHFEGVDITSIHQFLASPYLQTLTGVDRKGFDLAISAKWISARELSSLVSRTHLVLQHEAV